MMEYDKLDRKNREKYLDKMIFSRMKCIRRGLLGQGAFSDVYCVEALSGGRQYACKISSRVEMLEKEAQVMANLRHPLFPEYFSFQEAAGLGIFFREYVPGSCLKELLERRCFSAEQTARAGLELAEGLRYLHGRPEHFLFRDIKPANIIIQQDGKVRLIDFGCVCSMEGVITSRAGSPGFAAPEQLQDGGVLTEACDVYGLGQTLKAMLGAAEDCSHRDCEQGGNWTGLSEEGLYRSKTKKEKTERSICRRGRTGLQKAEERRGTYRERQVRRKLLYMLGACTEKKAENRIANMGEVVRELRGILGIFPGYPGMPDAGR